MISGRMNWRVTLLQPVKIPDGMGGSRSDFQPVGKVWAELRNVNTKEVPAVGAAASDLVRQISIRRRADVRRGWRAQIGGRFYDVLNTYDINREATMLVCREVTT